MTQVSSNTLAYDQIYVKLRQFYLKEMNNQFKSKQDRLEEYNKILAELHQSIMGPLAKFDPFIKGEPPFSEKFNKFSSDFTTDINTAAKQIDYVNAKLINGFNLFSQEIENEKKYVERIISKARILQMYNQSPSNDLIYYGDSFENSDKVDITKISVGRNPLIFNGMMTLPLSAKSNLKISKTSIEPSNGFMGNNHKVIRSTNSDNTSTYKYVFEGSPGMSTASNVSDSNPLTYFEYEAINVDKTTSNSYQFMSENEFCYITNSQVNTGLPNNRLINWSNKDVSSPLLLKVSFQSLTSEYVNNINIIPYFGSSQLIKVNQINIYNKNGMLENVLDIPIYIGSSFAPFDINIANNYFYNKANVKFSERQVSKVEIIFEQESFSDIQIQHVYWSPTDISANGPLRAMPRFNPDKLSSNLYQKIEYDKNALVPKISSPNQYKMSNTAPKPIKVTLEPKPIILTGYAVSFRVKETTGTNVMIDPKWRNTNGLKVYFFAWDQNQNFQWSEDIVYSNAQFTSRVYSNEAECEAERQKIIEYFFPSSVAISSTSYNTNTTSQTYTTSTAHGFTSGDTVAITGITPSSYNQTGVISVDNSTQFTIASFNGNPKSALAQGTTTFTASGTSVTAAGTYTGVTQSATNGSGSGAVFTITKTGSGTAYSGFTTATPVRTNLIPNPSFETNTTGWNPNGSTNTRVAGTWGTGSFVYQIVHTGTGLGGTFSNFASFVVTAGQSYTASFYAKSISGTLRTLQIAISWYNAGGTNLSSSLANQTLTTSSQRWSVTATAPATATTALIYAYTTTTGSIGDTWQMDSVLVERSSTLNTYFDGSTAGGSWSGTANNSTSIITAGGSNYQVGNTITIPGASLGGTTPANNLTLTVATKADGLYSSGGSAIEPGNEILPGPTGASWTLSVIPDSILVEQVSKTINIPSQIYHVEVKRNLEILNAKRMCIGIRDISMSYETYQNAAEMVSTPYLFDSNVDSVMLSIESDVDNTFADKVSINSYISVEDGKWIRISPIQMDSRGIAEVISFNQNISESAKLPGVAYLNYPEVPKDIRKISVKIEIDKDSKLNVTPKIYSYKLITKVKK
jgi:hypothetical protein